MGFASRYGGFVEWNSRRRDRDLPLWQPSKRAQRRIASGMMEQRSTPGMEQGFAMTDQDIRWLQRLSNYQRALGQLTRAVELAQSRPLSELERQGLIQAFEFVFELAWNLMKDYFVYQGNPAITGSRDAIRTAFKQGLVVDGEGWMEMIKSRNQTAHAYNESIAIEIAGRILARYQDLFVQFQQRMQGLASEL